MVSLPHIDDFTDVGFLGGFVGGLVTGTVAGQVGERLLAAVPQANIGYGTDVIAGSVAAGGLGAVALTQAPKLGEHSNIAEGFGWGSVASIAIGLFRHTPWGASAPNFIPRGLFDMNIAPPMVQRVTQPTNPVTPQTSRPLPPPKSIGTIIS